MKVYHWILLLLAVLIGWLVWVARPMMTIKNLPVDYGYDYLKKELLNQPNVELYNEDTPVVPIGDYKFILSRARILLC